MIYRRTLRKRRDFIRCMRLVTCAMGVVCWSLALWPPTLPVEAAEPLRSARVEKDPRVREYRLPTRILWQTPADAALVENAPQLTNNFSGQITLGGGPACVLRNNGKPAGVLLDFGRELHGAVQISVSDLKPASAQSKTVRVRVRFGESAAEAMSELGEADNATNDHAVRDQTILLPWLGSTEVGMSGFRFVRLDLVEPNTMVALKSVRAVYVHRNLPMIGSFRCNDERLNRIWDTGAYTVYLNMQEFVWDGIKRDRLVWIGDMHPETSTINAVFGHPAVVPASLDLIRNETPIPQWMNGISSYSMWWIIIQRDWYRHSGDLEYLRAQHKYLGGLVQALRANIGPDGSETLPATRFLDWPSSENPKAIHAGLQSLMALSFDAAGEMAAVLEDQPLKASCADAAKRVRQHRPDHGNSKQAAALMALAGLGDPKKLNRDVMAVDGAQRMSTFYGYYVLEARAKAGDYQGCLDVIRQYWGAMLDLGATTFWEDFDLAWVPGSARIDELVPPGKKDIHGQFGAYCYKGFRHSLCHGWASGPTAWLSAHVLGIEAIEPGCRLIRVTPHLGDLKWAEGTYPTPAGVLKVRHEKRPDGSIKSDIKAPEGIKLLQ